MSGYGFAVDAAAWGSPWRRRCVRDKSVLSLGLLGCVLALPWQVGVVAAVVSVAALAGPARVPVGLLVRALRVPVGFVVVGALTVAVSVGGDLVVSVTAESVASAWVALVRGVAGTCAVFVLGATTPMVDVLASLQRLGVPAALVDVAGLMYRLVFVFVESVEAVTSAQVARLVYVSRRAAARSAAGLMGSVMVRAWSRSVRLESGLAGRGFVDELVTLEPLRVRSWRFVVVSVVVVVGVVLLGLGVEGVFG
ncbi:Energy-coupling factor transporter transmembrane protein CbiQ [Dermatophilus congolensis]|uniref:Energy-coupling factor transporter transmembrane protein CbiQ n=1 Tax=Dermatophilus congolensis TaxID=1863 RepID=A0A239VFY2_9MICO|nr:cobalt ECF transporter T component CbiQ [Dermatophilus congolensis]SNV20920.1 Energy-coupling factor transporter transmembrane protein CbiQ [Dermatophilus congolensis]